MRDGLGFGPGFGLFEPGKKTISASLSQMIHETKEALMKRESRRALTLALQGTGGMTCPSKVLKLKARSSWSPSKKIRSSANNVWMRSILMGEILADASPL